MEIKTFGELINRTFAILSTLPYCQKTNWENSLHANCSTPFPKQPSQGDLGPVLVGPRWCSGQVFYEVFNYKPFDGTEDDVLWDTESNGSNGTTHSSGSEGDIVSVRRKQWIHCLQIFLLNVCQMKHYSLRPSRRDTASEKCVGERRGGN